jgi:4-amino-4-deoxy-L-arabinose transferase-like glycosyltransferase
VIKKIKKRYLILALILVLGIFFRTFQLVERYEFSHDGDLYAWIVKDIVIDHHPRLIGQLTSAQGVFIGPYFYYMLVPFFILTGMDPIGGLIPIFILGVAVLLSYYFVFTKLFNYKVGLLATFIQAVSLSHVWFDRAVVPSTPTNIWIIWYFYCLVSITRKNYRVLPILGVLIGLIWNIHIALLPTLLAIPAAILIAKKLPNRKSLSLFLLALFITSLPLILFETRHGFSQTQSIFNNFKTNHGGGTGLEKLDLNIIKISTNLDRLLFYPQSSPFDTKILLLLIIISPILLIQRKLLKVIDIIPLYIWMFGVLIFFTVSSSPVSEYYFASFDVIFICFIALLLLSLFKTSQIGKILVLALLFIVAAKNIYFYTNEQYYHKGYIEKKNVVEFIKTDAKQKGFPCVAVSYITPIGENVGFRYLFWYLKLHVNQPQESNSPAYTIVIPDELSKDSIDKRFGHVGIITPKYKLPSADEINKGCLGENQNLTDPLFGYTD